MSHKKAPSSSKRLKREATLRSPKKANQDQRTKPQVPIPGKTFNGLAHLRHFISSHKDLATLIGPIASFVIVVDANILIRELLWLLKKRKNPNAKPELLECLESRTFIAYITPQVAEEVERTIASLTEKRGFSSEEWKAHWRYYKSHLVIQNPDLTAVAKYTTGRDPTDAPVRRQNNRDCLRVLLTEASAHLGC